MQELWSPNDKVVMITAESYMSEIVSADSNQVWMLLFAKKRDDFSIRAKKLFDELALDFPDVKFGFVDIHEDEMLKVTFDVEYVS